MAVALSVALNDQPGGDGRIRLVPLGGNGISAPKSMYEVQIDLDHDSSSGNAVITIGEDPRFKSIATLMVCQYVGAAAGIEVMFDMRNLAHQGPFARGFANAVPIASISSISTAVWNPPPLMTMDQWQMTTANVTGDSMFLDAWFYNFDRRILELSPMWQILANLPRAGTMDSFSAV